MSLSDLSKKRIIEQFRSEPQQVRDQMALARAKLKSAKNILGINEWEEAHNAAYHAMQAAGRALMYDKGYRPMSADHHVAVILFVQAVHGNKFGPEVLKAFDNARKNRSESLYDAADTISPTQAKNLITKAEFFVSKAAEILKL
jgi:uncharacterized protein (UPF0332 family)